MKLWRISQKDRVYDTYDSAIVAAVSKADAKKIRPDGSECEETRHPHDTWCAISEVEVEYVGVAAKKIKRGVILASFNAG